MQGARPIYIYRLAPCTENCSQRISKTFSLKYLEEVHFFNTFEPKKCRSVFQAAMSACILQILCCGYNRATQKRRKFIKGYDTRICKENSFFLSLRKQGCKSASYAIYTLYYTHKKVRLSVFYLTIHKYSLNCRKEWWIIFFL